MFGLFKKDPIKKLEQKYNDLLIEARDAQRSGDIKAYAKLMEESEQVQKEIENLQNKQ